MPPDGGGWRERIRLEMATTKLSVQFTLSEYRQRASTYALGLASVVIVVWLVASLLTGTSKTPVVFMKLAEEQTGEMDILMLKDFRNARAAAGGDGDPFSSGGLPLLNYTDLDEKLRRSKFADAMGVAPRWLLTAGARRKWQTPSTLSNASDSVAVTIVMVDTAKEQQLRLGRLWPHRKLGEAEAHVNADLLEQLNIEGDSGDHIIVEIDLNRMAQEINLGTIELPGGLRIFEAEEDRPKTLNASTNASANASSAVQNLPTLRLDLDVIASVGSPAGKWPSALGNVIVLDSKHFIHTMTEQVCYHAAYLQGGGELPTVAELAKELPVDEYAILVNALFEGREDVYTKPLFDMNRDITARSNDFFEAVGYRSNITTSFPLAGSMVLFYFLRLFLDQIFNATIIVFVALGTILTYSLLLTNIQEKTFQHGMLRALGMPKRGLMNLITLQALSFATPGVLIAMVLAVAMNAVIEEMLSDFSGFEAQHGRMPTLAIVFPIFLGFAVPLLANIIPIRKAMQTTLRSALDISHQQSSETQVTLQRLEDMGLAVWQTAIACLMIAFGFMVYYLMPYAFIFNDLPVFFYILLFILCFLLFGLCMITMAMQSSTEHALLWCFLYGKDKMLGSLVRKNLAAHRERSSKTYIMFTLSTAAVIFGGVVFRLQARSIGENIRTMVGADVHVWSLNFDTPIERPPLENLFSRPTFGVDGHPTPLKGHAFATFPLNEHDFVNDIDVSNLMNFPVAGLSPTGVDPSLLDVMHGKYFITEGVQSGIARGDIFNSLARKTAGEGLRPGVLYSGVPLNATDEAELAERVMRKYDGSIPVVMSAGARPALSVTERTAGTLSVEYSLNRSTSSETEVTRYLLSPRALVSKMPGWRESVSSYAFLFPRSPVFMSVENFKRVLRDLADPAEWPDDAEARYAKMFLRFKDGATAKDKKAYINEMKAFLDREEHIILDADALVGSLDQGVGVLMMFFYIISTISLLLNMFLLWVSFQHNVAQNAYAFAVMRSLGFTVTQLIRAYIYEALSTVLAAFLWGSAVGIVIALTLAINLNMFMELPLEMEFPYLLLFVVFCEAVFCAVVGSWLPARQLRDKEIAQVLKGK
eukprot:TRINITY_DN13486_c0_g1_i1.p1 TRINITY_DN13486_c0_g1~~TRINITY_DN13486_c0_g1_i1.p1  ORF type:complete len:1114 (+),score=414.00 TRINITY_DN13486_c0_g1_i1:45-3344(+)